MGIGLTELIIIMALAAGVLFYVLNNSSTKRPCPFCRTMMPKKMIKCAHCHKPVPLGY